MSNARVAAVPVLATLALLWVSVPASALMDVPGGAQARSSPATGTSQRRAAPGHPRVRPRPILASLSIPAYVVAGRPPRVALRIEEAGVARVDVQVTVIALTTSTPVLVASLGWVHTGHTLIVTWPAHATLAPGGYRVSVSARDRRGGTLPRSAHGSGDASLTVHAPPAEVRAPGSLPPAPALEAGVPTPAQTLADGAVFPVAGPHSFGGPENRFGAPRDGYLHQGQDVLTAEGTSVVAALAGTILTTGYQAEGAGYYAVEQTAIGFDFMFAHCQAGSLALSSGQALAAGQVLCAAGQTGDATTPHLDFEIWVGGWQAHTGYPIDPLAYLEAWEQ